MYDPEKVRNFNPKTYPVRKANRRLALNAWRTYDTLCDSNEAEIHLDVVSQPYFKRMNQAICANRDLVVFN